MFSLDMPNMLTANGFILGLDRVFCWFPHPFRPIMITRPEAAAMGSGYYSTTASDVRGSRQGSILSAWFQSTISPYYRATAENSPSHVCACARASACGCEYICGSGVVDRFQNVYLVDFHDEKRVFRYYLGHYLAYYLASACGSGWSKSLKSFGNSKILGENHG